MGRPAPLGAGEGPRDLVELMTRFFYPTGKREKPFVSDKKWWDETPFCHCGHGKKAHDFKQIGMRYLYNRNDESLYRLLRCKVPGCGCMKFRLDEITTRVTEIKKRFDVALQSIAFQKVGNQ